MIGQPVYKPDIIETLQKEGVELHRKGRNLWALCPLPGHTEKTPSFKADSEKQRYYCFGCHRNGDSIHLIMEMHSLTYPQALHHIGIGNCKRPKRSEPEHIKHILLRVFREWEKSYSRRILDVYRDGNKLMASIRTEEELEAVGDFYHDLALIEHRLDVLDGHDDKAKYDLFMEVTNGKL